MDVRVARRYAQALLVSAQAQQSVTEVGEDLTAIARILEAKAELKEVIDSPEVPRDKKRALVDKLFADRARPLTMRLLRLLIEKGRQKELPLIREQYDRLVEEANGFLRVQIVSAVPLRDDEVDKIVSRIAQQTGKKIIAERSVDPNLIGGVAVQYGSSVLDGSVSGTLKRLRERLFIDVLKQA